MITAVDTDVLVHWAMQGASQHQSMRRLWQREIANGNGLGLTPQVFSEFLHIVTDPKRFPRPMSMDQGLEMAERLRGAKEIVHILPDSSVPNRVAELMRRFSLGRKRILDTMLAATLDAASITRLATLNPKHFQIFSFLDLVK